MPPAVDRTPAPTDAPVLATVAGGRRVDPGIGPWGRLTLHLRRHLGQTLARARNASAVADADRLGRCAAEARRCLTRHGFAWLSREIDSASQSIGRAAAVIPSRPTGSRRDTPSLDADRTLRALERLIDQLDALAADAKPSARRGA